MRKKSGSITRRGKVIFSLFSGAVILLCHVLALSRNILIGVIVPFIEIQGSEPNDVGINWQQGPEGRWEINDPIDLAPGD